MQEPTELAEDRSKLPQCTVTVTTPTHTDPCSSAVAELSHDGQVHTVQLVAESTAPLNAPLRLLDTLLNAPLRIDVLLGGAVVGQATLDLCQLATEGRSTIKRGLPVPLTPHPNLEGVTLSSAARVTVTVSILQDSPAPLIAEGSLPLAAVPSTDNLKSGSHLSVTSSSQAGVPGINALEAGGRTPLYLVTPVVAEASTVVELRMGAVKPTPASFGPVATLAGDMTFDAACSWISGAACAGAICPGGRFNDGAVVWAASRRTYLPPDSFAELRQVVSSGEPLYFELARCANPLYLRRSCNSCHLNTANGIA